MCDGVNWFVENVNVDCECIGIYGGLYGGFLIFMFMFIVLDLFVVGVVFCLVIDWVYYNMLYIVNILNMFDIDFIVFECSLLIYFVDGLEKLLFINVFMVDDNVFFYDIVWLV